MIGIYRKRETQLFDNIVNITIFTKTCINAKKPLFELRKAMTTESRLTQKLMVHIFLLRLRRNVEIGKSQIAFLFWLLRKPIVNSLERLSQPTTI